MLVAGGRRRHARQLSTGLGTGCWVRLTRYPVRSDGDTRRGAWLLPTLLALVFLSGLAALVYQVLWLRLLALVFGVTVWAASTVLASFMGGLALGSFTAARASDGLRSPLRWYGMAELAIGLSALATPVALDGVEQVYVLLASAIGGQLGLITALRVALTCAVLLVPTALMGVTLPLVTRAALAPGTGMGERVSLLYATNTAGAIAGVLLSGMYLVGGVGISAAFLIAASLNAFVGLVAIALSFRIPASGPLSSRSTTATTRPLGGPISERARRLLLLVFTFSGFASFALEVVWFRVLVFYVAATTYAFTMMLAVVLAGIAAGSYAAAVSAGSGLLLLAVMRARRQALALGAAGTLAFAAALAVVPDPFAAALERRYVGERVLWFEEGVQSTVSVHLAADGMRVLYLDGLHQASDRPELVAVHRTIGHLPMALHPEPRRVLVVGLGGGVTAGAVARHRGASVDVVELSPGVLGAAAWFGHVNDDVLGQPNVRVRVDDARNHLLLRPGPYDVITADIIQPHHAGAGNVYSAEYFRLVRDALADDGIALQWIGPFAETRHKLIMRTFLSVFPETTLWADGTLMVGAKRPLRLDPAAFARRLADGPTREALASVGIRDFGSLLALYWAGPEELRDYVGAGDLLTDDRPMVEYFLSLPLREAPPDLTRVRGRPDRYILR